MTDLSQIKEHMEVIGADGVHVGTVDHLDGADLDDPVAVARENAGGFGIEDNLTH